MKKNRTGTPMVGAGNRMAYRRTSDLNPMSDNQNGRRISAGQLDLIAALQAFARHALDTTPDLTTKERRFLDDMCRQDIRYGFGALDRLLQLAPRTKNPHGLEQAIRGQIIRHTPRSTCVVDSWLDESAKQGPADHAHDVFIVERTAVRRDGALDRLAPHLDALQRAIDSLHAWTPNGRSFA